MPIETFVISNESASENWDQKGYCQNWEIKDGNKTYPAGYTLHPQVRGEKGVKEHINNVLKNQSENPSDNILLPEGKPELIPIPDDVAEKINQDPFFVREY